MKFIVGLGNPGEKYEHTRHSVGFMVVDKMVEIKKLSHACRQAGNWKLENKYQFHILKSRKAVFVKPMTFMNSSGLAVRRIPQYLNISISQYLKNLYIIHDDLDIGLGEYKIQFAKGPKLHNGLKSVEQHLKTNKFWRVRVGIAGDIKKLRYGEIKGSEYVLLKFSRKEKLILNKTIIKVCEKLLSLL